jgi:hypothetical protein
MKLSTLKKHKKDKKIKKTYVKIYYKALTISKINSKVLDSKDKIAMMKMIIISQIILTIPIPKTDSQNSIFQPKLLKIK